MKVNIFEYFANPNNILIITKNTKKVDDNTFWIEFCGSRANGKWSKHAFLQDEVSNSQYWYSIPFEVRALSLEFDPAKIEELITPMK
jgi:hypothetical protein